MGISCPEADGFFDLATPTGRHRIIVVTMKTLTCLLGITLLPVLAIAKDKDKAKANPLPTATLAEVSFSAVVNDVPFDKTALAGKVVVIEEWGVNCPPCIASLPRMAKLAQAGEGKGLIVVGMEQQGSSKEAILNMLKAAKVKYPVMSGGSTPGGNGTIPRVCVFDTTGKMVFDGRPADENFEKTVKKELHEIKK